MERNQRIHRKLVSAFIGNEYANSLQLSFLCEEQVNEYRSAELAQNPLNDLFFRPLLEFFGTQSCDSEGLFWF